MAGAKPHCGSSQFQSPRRGGPQAGSRVVLSPSMRDMVATARRDSTNVRAISGWGTPLYEIGDLGLDRREADSATTRLRAGCVLAHFDHEWNRHDSELLRAKPDHDATIEAPHPFRIPAVARHRPTCAAAYRWLRLPAVRQTTGLSHTSPQRGHRGKPEIRGRAQLLLRCHIVQLRHARVSLRWYQCDCTESCTTASRWLSCRSRSAKEGRGMTVPGSPIVRRRRLAAELR